MTIYITGDTHGEVDLDKLQGRNLDRLGIVPKNEDFLIICGDVACIWDTKPFAKRYSRRDKSLIRRLQQQPWTVLFVDGNHDNHDALNAMLPVEWQGGLVHRIDDRLIHLLRGECYSLDGLRIFSFGGARSTDKACRVEGVSWWAAEYPDDDQIDAAEEALRKLDDKVDLVITHQGPTKCLESMDGHHRIDGQSNWFQQLSENLSFKTWAFGHMHEDSDAFDDERIHAVYNSFLRVTETGEVERIGACSLT